MKTRNKIILLLMGFLGTVVLFFIVLYFSVPKFINLEVVKKKVNAYFLQKTGAPNLLGVGIVIIVIWLLVSGLRKGWRKRQDRGKSGKDVRRGWTEE